MNGFLVKTFADIGKFILWADLEEGKEDSKKAKLIFSFRDGNPRFTVYTGVPGKDGVISFPSDIPTMTYIFQLIKEAATAEPDFKQVVSSLTSVYVDNKPTNEKKVLSNLYIGKSKEGIVYLSLIMEGKPKIIFTIKPSAFHVFKDKDGNLIKDSIVSAKMAIGISNFLLNIMSSVIMEYTKEEYNTIKKPNPIKSMSVEVGTGGITELDDISM